MATKIIIKTKDRLDINRIAKRVDMALCLWNIHTKLRKSLEDKVDTNTLDIVIAQINEYFEEDNISINDLIE